MAAELVKKRANVRDAELTQSFMASYGVTRHLVERSTHRLFAIYESYIATPGDVWLSPEREQRASRARGKQKASTGSSWGSSWDL